MLDSVPADDGTHAVTASNASAVNVERDTVLTTVQSEGLVAFRIMSNRNPALSLRGAP
jgi:hypothetical protein